MGSAARSERAAYRTPIAWSRPSSPTQLPELSVDAFDAASPNWRKRSVHDAHGFATSSSRFMYRFDVPPVAEPSTIRAAQSSAAHGYVISTPPPSPSGGR